MNQGKFWEMHHSLFENQEPLEQTDIESTPRRSASTSPSGKPTESEATADRIEKDKKLGDGSADRRDAHDLHQRSRVRGRQLT